MHHLWVLCFFNVSLFLMLGLPSSLLARVFREGAFQGTCTRGELPNHMQRDILRRCGGTPNFPSATFKLDCSFWCLWGKKVLERETWVSGVSVCMCLFRILKPIVLSAIALPLRSLLLQKTGSGRQGLFEHTLLSFGHVSFLLGFGNIIASPSTNISWVEALRRSRNSGT